MEMDKLINIPFYSALVRACLTILAISLAFYGGLMVYLGQQAKEYRQEVVQCLKDVDTAIETFSNVIDPTSVYLASWSVPMKRESNARDIMSSESWTSSPVEIFSPIAQNVITNCTQAYEEDQQIIDWLMTTMNVTHFLAHYNLAVFSLNKLVYAVYREFPPSPGVYTAWRGVEYFVSSDFPACKESFLKWAQRYSEYYSGVSQIRSEISPALQNISEAHIDAAKLDSQRLEQAIKENETDIWYVEHLKTFVNYRTAQSTYYKTIFEELDEIDNSVDVATNAIHTHDQFFGLAFSNLQYPLSIMAITGVLVPMILLGLGENIDARGPKWVQLRRILTAVCIIAFGVSTMWIIYVIWQQFSALYLV